MVKTKKTNSKKTTKKRSTERRKEKNVGNVYRGETKYIDRDTKKTRNYVVVLDNGKNIEVAKLKSIKIFDTNNKNADKALIEINATKYGLTKRTGVDFERFAKNRITGKKLSLKDKDAFPEDNKEFKLSSHDLHRVLKHTKKKKKRDK